MSPKKPKTKTAIIVTSRRKLPESPVGWGKRNRGTSARIIPRAAPAKAPVIADKQDADCGASLWLFDDVSMISATQKKQKVWT